MGDRGWGREALALQVYCDGSVKYFSQVSTNKGAFFLFCDCWPFQETTGGRRTAIGSATRGAGAGDRPGAGATERHLRALQVRQLPPVAQGSRTRAARILPDLRVS